MVEAKQDIWSQWLLQRRFGGDSRRMKFVLDFLYPICDKVLTNAQLGEGKVLLDVGCGDGLLAFRALERAKTNRVVFGDISHDLLNHARSIAQEMQVLNRCEFLCTPVKDIAVRDGTVDAVTTRSVLIYVAAKRQAFDEFYRVLKPNGRLSIFEPINRFRYPEPAHLKDGYDVTPVIEIAQKIKAVYRRLQPDTDPLLDFDERDLLAFAEEAGFYEIHLELHAQIAPLAPLRQEMSWETYWRTAWSPKIPTLEEAVNQALTPEEAKKFVAHLRPLVEAKQGMDRMAYAYLWAVKS